MAINLKGRSFLTLEDFTPAEIRYLLDLGHDLKAKRRAGICDPTLQGKHIVLLFEKTSTRTRCSFEVAATQEGGHVTYLDAGSSQMGKKESLEDTAKVLGRFFDGIEYRGYDQKVVEDLAKYAGVPVWNGLTDADHPTQILADMMTIEEHCHKPLNQVKVVFPGDVRNNMCYAWMIGAAKMGMHFVGLGPQELAKEMDGTLVKRVFATARENGGLIEITDNMNSLKDADVICTACPPAMTLRPSWPRSGRTRAWTSGRSPTRCSAAATVWYSTRRRTGCTPSKLCWWPPSEDNSWKRRRLFRESVYSYLHVLASLAHLIAGKDVCRHACCRQT